MKTHALVSAVQDPARIPELAEALPRDGSVERFGLQASGQELETWPDGR